MAQFNVDDELAIRLERMAKQKPFEQLSFNEALRRVLDHCLASGCYPAEATELDVLKTEAVALAAKKAPSPSPLDWVAGIPELKAKKGLTNWKAICDVLAIDTAGDSARRRLKNWVKANRPKWPPVPDV